MVFSLFKDKAAEGGRSALSGAANTHQANLRAAGPAAVNTTSTLEKPSTKSDVNLGALHQSQPPTNQEPVYKGDPDSQVIVFDMDETTIDTGDKRPIDEGAVERLGRKVETIAKDASENSFGQELKYVLRPGVKELFEYLHNKGHKIVLTTRNYKEYADTIAKHEPVFKQYVSGVLSRPDFEKNPINRDFKKYPRHPDKLSFWQKTKALFAKVFIKAPKYCWHKVRSVFTGQPARWDPGRGSLGKYPPNILELLAANGNHKLAGLKPARFLIDNQAGYKTGNPNDSGAYKYCGREFEDSRQAGDFAVISPNVIRDNGHIATSFHADAEEPHADNSEYLWVKNVKEAIDRGWKEQYRLTTGQEPKI